VKALILKEVLKASLRYAGELSIFGVRILKSTLLRAWEYYGEVLKNSSNYSTS
jgi:hypothetical protein